LVNNFEKVIKGCNSLISRKIGSVPDTLSIKSLVLAGLIIAKSNIMTIAIEKDIILLLFEGLNLVKRKIPKVAINIATICIMPKSNRVVPYLLGENIIIIEFMIEAMPKVV
jgi:hypothetical protein